MAAPALLSQAIGAPTLLVKGGRKVWQQGKAKLAEGTDALANSTWGAKAQDSWTTAKEALASSINGSQTLEDESLVAARPPASPSATRSTLGGTSATAGTSVADAAGKAGQAVAGAGEAAVEYTAEYAEKAAEAGGAALAGLQRRIVVPTGSADGAGKSGGALAKDASTGSLGELSAVKASSSQRVRTAFVVWVVIAAGLYIASMVLLILGIVSGSAGGALQAQACPARAPALMAGPRRRRHRCSSTLCTTRWPPSRW